MYVTIDREREAEIDKLILAGLFWSYSHVFNRSYEYWKERHSKDVARALKDQARQEVLDGSAEGSTIRQ